MYVFGPGAGYAMRLRMSQVLGTVAGMGTRWVTKRAVNWCPDCPLGRWVCRLRTSLEFKASVLLISCAFGSQRLCTPQVCRVEAKTSWGTYESVRDARCRADGGRWMLERVRQGNCQIEGFELSPVCVKRKIPVQREDRECLKAPTDNSQDPW